MSAPTVDRAAECSVRASYLDALYRLDSEDAAVYPPERWDADRDVVRRYELAARLAVADARTAPNGCRFCGVLERGHGRRYDGRHPRDARGFSAPDDALRLLRMRARRWSASGRLSRAIAARFESLGAKA